MKILITNDDGIGAPGLEALAEVATQFGEVTVVAPHRERSTSGHSLTLHKPLRVFEVEKNRYAATGSPADCVYLGIREVLKEKPDWILSGINAGANLGTDIHYSGTVAAAREGAILKIPSVAFSLVDSAHALSKFPQGGLQFGVAAKHAARFLERLKSLKFPPHCLLNVNIPNASTYVEREFSICRQGVRHYSNEVVRREDPRGKTYFWIGGSYVGFEPDPASDCEALEAGKIAVTPIAIDCTHVEFYQSLTKSFNDSLGA